ARKHVAELWKRQASQVAEYLLAAAKQRDEAGLDPERLKQWTKALGDESLSSVDHPLYAWSQRTKQAPTSDAELGTAPPKQSDEGQRQSAAAEIFEDFNSQNFERWFMTGNAFGVGPAKAGALVIGNDPTRPIARLTTGGADSGV